MKQRFLLKHLGVYFNLYSLEFYSIMNYSTIPNYLTVNGSEHGISEDFEINDDEPQVKRIKTEIQIDETMTVDPDDVERLLMNSLNGDMNESNNLPIDDYCVDQSGI